MKILVLFAHPAYERSRVNRALVDAVKDMEGLTFHDLYEACPDFHIDVRREQEILVAHDIVVLQHPFYWYSAPAILKEWQDLVLEHGWAYGSRGTALRGKILLNATTTGGPREAYGSGGYNRFTMRHLLAPYEQTARLCGMRYLAPHVVHGSLALRTPEDAAPEGARYRRALEALRDGRVDVTAAETAEYLTDVLGG